MLARMLWLSISALFGWLVMRELTRGLVHDGPDRSPVDKGYVAVMAAIAIGFAYPPVRTWQFERFLTAKARILAENPRAHVHCNTVFDTFFDSNVFAAGHATPETGRIVLQHPWCGRLMDHLDDPAKATREGMHAAHLFAHEAMHIRGELNEAATDCQAIQRHARAASLLGIPEHLGKASGLAYYRGDYQQRAAIGGLAGMYYSSECAPGKALDERLPDSIWN